MRRTGVVGCQPWELLRWGERGESPSRPDIADRATTRAPWHEGGASRERPREGHTSAFRGVDPGWKGTAWPRRQGITRPIPCCGMRASGAGSSWHKAAGGKVCSLSFRPPKSRYQSDAVFIPGSASGTDDPRLERTTRVCKIKRVNRAVRSVSTPRWTKDLPGVGRVNPASATRMPSHRSGNSSRMGLQTGVSARPGRFSVTLATRLPQSCHNIGRSL
jgi:hypothetical protein